MNVPVYQADILVRETETRQYQSTREHVNMRHDSFVDRLLVPALLEKVTSLQRLEDESCLVCSASARQNIAMSEDVNR